MVAARGRPSVTRAIVTVLIILCVDRRSDLAVSLSLFAQLTRPSLRSDRNRDVSNSKRRLDVGTKGRGCTGS
jgi:hypothetical protein